MNVLKNALHKCFNLILLRKNDIITDDNFLPPIDLGIYIKQKKIGRGSYAKVYTISEKNTGKILAAKILNQKLEEDLDISDVQREINIISKTIHPSILKFYG